MNILVLHFSRPGKPKYVQCFNHSSNRAVCFEAFAILRLVLLTSHNCSTQARNMGLPTIELKNASYALKPCNCSRSTSLMLSTEFDTRNKSKQVQVSPGSLLSWVSRFISKHTICKCCRNAAIVIVNVLTLPDMPTGPRLMGLLSMFQTTRLGILFLGRALSLCLLHCQSPRFSTCA